MLTNFPNGISSFGVPVLGGVGGIPFNGNYYFVDPVTGADGNPGTSDLPLATLYAAHGKCTAGNNDVVIIVGDGSTTATCRLSKALAQAYDSSATSGKLIWSKNATHLVGMTAPTMYAQRARIAPPSGTYTVTTFGSADFISVTASGCYFGNFSIFNGFSTGGAAQRCWVDTGGRNYYQNVQFGGMGDAGSAADAGSRSVVLSGTTGENTFVGCVFGLDTVSRGAANASLEFAAGTPRNTFIDCAFPFQTSAATPLGILGTGAACMDRFQEFIRCRFVNNVESTSTAMTVLSSMTNASPGGGLLFKDCVLLGITDFGDTNALTVAYVEGGTPTAATTGIAVTPT